MSLRKALIPTPSRIEPHPRNTQESTGPGRPRGKAVSPMKGLSAPSQLFEDGAVCEPPLLPQMHGWIAVPSSAVPAAEPRSFL